MPTAPFGEPLRLYVKNIKLEVDGSDSAQWSKSYLDSLGRTYKTLHSGGASPASQSFFNAKGQRWKEVDPHGVATLFGMNARGEVAYSAIDSNRNDVIDFDGLDRVTQTTNDGVTPSTTYAYNRLGRQEWIGKGSHSWHLLYTLAGQLKSEAATAGPLSGLAVTNLYDAWHRRTTATLRQGAGALTSRTYTYNDAGDLATVGDGTHTAAYSYLANSDLIAETAFKQSSTVRMTTARTYDLLNRLRSTVSAPSGASSFSHTYAYNPANQRTRMTLADGSYWSYEYDSLGQITHGKRHWNDGAPVAGQQFQYGFDDIGNRTETAVGGDAGGDNLATAGYSVNALNQYTARDVPGQVDVFGVARGTVTVNGQSAYRRQEYFWKRVEADNSADPVWQEVDVVATDGSSTDKEGHVLIPETPEAFSYDWDGNLTGDGRWTYGWDAENRLILMVSATTEGPPRRIEYDYDYQGRRIGKKVWDNTAGTGDPALDLRYVYDGWNLLGEIGEANQLLRSYVWGLDLSGSEQGAGGVGGLVAMKVHTGPKAGTFFAVMDGNGNVMGDW